MSELLIRLALRFFRALAKLPYPWLQGIGAVLSPLIYCLAVPRRKITLRNLALCFPDWSPEQRTAVAKRHFRAYVQTFLDRFIFWYGSQEDIRRACRVEGLEHLHSNLGKPLLILSPHFVGMDAGGLRLQTEAQLFGMYARQNSAALTHAMTEGRERFNGAKMLLRTEGIRPAIKRIKQNIPFYFCPDMDLGPKDALFVPFFGVPAATVTTLHHLAKMTGARVLPYVTYLGDEGYVARIEPPWENFPSDDVQADVRRMNAFIEQTVLRHPEQYLWSHRRFKTRPPGEPSLYL